MRRRGSPFREFIRFVCERLSLAVVAVGTIVMVLVFVVVEDNATHIGYFPIVFEHNDNRVEVESAPAGGEALRTGDRVDLEALTQPQRFSLLRGAPARETIALQASRGERRFTTHVAASAVDHSPRAVIARDVGTPLCFFVSLALASALFLIQPRTITLAFYLYTMLMLVKVNQTALDLANWPISLASDLVIQVLYPLTQIMILVFAQRLYGRPSRRWPWFFYSAVALSLVAFVAWVDPLVWIVYQRYGFPGPAQLFMSLSDIALLSVVIAGLAYIASGATLLDRRRVTWVVAGIALSPILDLTWAITNAFATLIGNSSTTLLYVQHWTDVLAPWFGLAGSIFVVYGFLSERVVDFRFAIGRAAIYGGVTAVLLLCFGALEWWAEKIFETTRPAIYLSLFAALAIGLTLNTLHGRIEGWLNSVFFRDQKRADDALRRAARALATTSSEKTLIEFLVEEPVRVLDLTSAALFLARREGGEFERTAARGWTREETERIDPEDPLIVELRAELGPVVLDGRPRAETILPGGAKAPSLVVPLVMRATVFGFVFYGVRSSGLALSPDERILLESIAVNAAAAFDHIDAERSRARIHELERRLHELGAPP